MGKVEVFPYLLAGEWGKSDTVKEVRSPHTGEAIYAYYQPDSEVISKALDASLEGYKQMARLSSNERANLLHTISRLIYENRKTLAQVIVQEAGKPIRYAEGEVARAIQTFRFAAELTSNLRGETIPLDFRKGLERYKGVVQRFPIGPVLAISPFNFPLNLVAHKYAPNFLAGNSVIHKPASATPITAFHLTRLCLEAGLPQLGLQYLPFSASQMDTLIESNVIKALTFTGSAEVGWNLKQKAYRKKVVLELGGNAMAVITPSAPKMPNETIPKKALDACIEAAYAYAGQVCISLQILFIHQSLYPQARQYLIERIQQLPYGDPMDPNTIVGPLIAKSEVERLLEWHREAQKEGARVLIEPRHLPPQLLTPALYEEVPTSCKIISEEVFGPFLSIYPYENLDEAIDQINQSRYGLQSAIFSTDAEEIAHFYHHVEVGGIIVNFPPTFRVDLMPYGGVKASGFGREGLRYAYEHLTEPRLLVTPFL